MKPKTFTELLLVPLTDEDLAKLADQADQFTARLQELQNEKRTLPKRIDSVTEELFEISEKRRSKQKRANVNCEERPDFDSGKVDIVRLDTGEIIRSRIMSDEDRQSALFENPAGHDGSEVAREVIEEIEELTPDRSDVGTDLTEAQFESTVETPQPFEPIAAPAEPNPLQDKLGYQVFHALHQRAGAANRWAILRHMPENGGQDKVFLKACAIELSGSAWLSIAAEDCTWAISKKDDRIKFYTGTARAKGTPTLDAEAFLETARRVLGIERKETENGTE
jgi:hypothetical protein